MSMAMPIGLLFGSMNPIGGPVDVPTFSTPAALAAASTPLAAELSADGLALAPVSVLGLVPAVAGAALGPAVLEQAPNAKMTTNATTPR
jgi:hypothetical protein